MLCAAEAQGRGGRALTGYLRPCVYTMCCVGSGFWSTQLALWGTDSRLDKLA